MTADRMTELCAELDAHFDQAEGRMEERFRRLRDERPDVFDQAPAVIETADVSQEAKDRAFARWKLAAGAPQ